MATSQHFTDAELQCHCGCGRNNVNPVLLAILEQLRLKIGRQVVLSSAARCPARQMEISGQQCGAHVDGDAADIAVSSDIGRHQIVAALLALGVKRLGLATDFVHVDVSDHLPQPVIWLYP